MSDVRSYADPCGTARALNVIGERWALLTVRELLFGPRRFGQLRQALRGVSPNVLAQRLRDLEARGVVRRDVLEPPASVAVYELTDRGAALEPILLELGRWGSREPITSDNELTVAALLLAFKTVFVPASTERTYAVHLEGEWYSVDAGATIHISRGRPEDPMTSFDTDVATLRAVAFGRLPLADAEAAGRITVRGDRRAARRFPKYFAVPLHAAPRV